MTISADLKGQVALVTGAGRGVGHSVSTALARSGAGVVLAARTASQIEAVAAEIARSSGGALAVPADVSREEEVLALFGRIEERFEGRLDVLVNNAGVGIFGPLESFSAAEFDRVMAMNVRGTFLCCREAVRLMKPQRAGWIINVSSVVGFKGYPNQSAYTSSKHGVVGLTKPLAVEVQPHGIRVSVILPGGVDTDLAGAALSWAVGEF